MRVKINDCHIIHLGYAIVLSSYISCSLAYVRLEAQGPPTDSELGKTAK